MTRSHFSVVAVIVFVLIAFTPTVGALLLSQSASAETANQAMAPVTLALNDIFFDPNTLAIPANTDVTIALKNEGVTLHNFSVDALGTSVDVPAGETTETVLNAPAGTYEYYCNVPGHREAGMVGTLTVEAGAAVQPTTLAPTGVSTMEAASGPEATISALQTEVAQLQSPVPTETAVAVGPSPTATNATAGENEQATKTVNVELILDVSGSMAQVLDTGETRMDAAKRVLNQVIASIPDRKGINVGLRIYGFAGDNTDAGQAVSCQSSELTVPATGVDKGELGQQISALQPTGWTPIALSLQRAAADFPTANENVTNAVVLVTDGLETCGGRPRCCRRRPATGGRRRQLRM